MAGGGGGDIRYFSLIVDTFTVLLNAEAARLIITVVMIISRAPC